MHLLLPAALCLIGISCLTAADPYYRSLQDEAEAAGLPRGAPLFGDSEAAALATFNLAAGANAAAMETIDVSDDGVPFSQARRITITLPSSREPWAIRFENKAPRQAVAEGDVVWAVVW